MMLKRPPPRAVQPSTRPIVVPSNVYDPPVSPEAAAPVPAIIGDGSTREVVTQPLLVTGGLETSIRLTRTWKAVDVYVSVPGVIAGGNLAILSVMIYAVSGQSARTLVASGRFRQKDQATQIPIPEWVAAARAGAQSYEVVTRWYSTVPLGADEGSITVVGSDVETPVPFEVGIVTLGAGGVQAGLWLPLSGGLSVPQLLIERVMASNGAAIAAGRWFQIFDGGFAPGAQPLFSFGLGPSAGHAVSVDLGYRLRYSGGSVVFGMSSTPDVYTAAADGAAQLLVR